MAKRFVRKEKNTISAVTALEKAQELVFAPMTFQAVASLLDFGILQYINNYPSTTEQIMNALNLDEYTTVTLLQIAEVTDIVEIRNDEFHLTKKGQAFLFDEMTIANFNFVKDVCYLGSSEMTNSFKDKKPRGLHKFISEAETIYPILSELPENIKKSWYEFDHLYSDNCFDKILEIILKKHNEIVDIGGNTGKFERVCLKQSSKCKITMLDLPENISVVINNPELEGCNFYPINVLSNNAKYPELKNCAILMSQFLDCFSKEQIAKILTDLKEQMDKDSSIYILEPFTDNQNYKAAKLSLTHISLYFTAMANGYSKMYTQQEMIKIIETVGLKLVNCHNNIGPFDYTLLECQK